MTRYYVRIIDENGTIGETIVKASFAESAATQALNELDYPELRCWNEGDTLIAAVSKSANFALEDTSFVRIEADLCIKHYAEEVYLEYDDEYADEARKLMEHTR